MKQYYREPLFARARQVTGGPESIEYRGRTVQVKPGDYIAEINGTKKPVPKEEFEANFIPAENAPGSSEGGSPERGSAERGSAEGNSPQRSSSQKSSPQRNLEYWDDESPGVSV